MERRSLFSKIFGSDKSTNPPITATNFQILDSFKSVFTKYDGKFEDDIDIRTCIDAIARNAAKMHAKHIRRKDNKLEIVDDNLYRIISKNLMNYKMLINFIIRL